MLYPAEIRLKKKYKKILVISDLQMPCEHEDSIRFLKKLKNEVKPDLVINIGDLVDLGAVSNYDSNPNYMSPSDEIKLAKKKLKKLAAVFPEMYVTLGNHDIRAYRKAAKHGIPDEVLKTFETVYDTPKGWTYCRDLKVHWNNPSTRILFTHQGSTARCRDIAMRGCSFVRGHNHTRFSIDYLSTPDSLRFDMIVGCLIDDSKMVFDYNKLQLDRPVLGCGVIINNFPKLVPMLLNKKGRWSGNLYLGHKGL